MGAEFFGKGANVQLGPGVNVARVPRNGRNFEYISGEDPFLGYTLVQPAVAGIQSQGVIANAKHYVLNNQETNRGFVSDNADERTRFEVYYMPFRGAVEAGVGSVMVSHGRLNCVCVSCFVIYAFFVRVCVFVFRDVSSIDRDLHVLSCVVSLLALLIPCRQCSYNQIFSNWACENNMTLNVDLKGRMAYDGWVMSDWYVSMNCIERSHKCFLRFSAI